MRELTAEQKIARELELAKMRHLLFYKEKKMAVRGGRWRRGEGGREGGGEESGKESEREAEEGGEEREVAR
jgi:hypothetical protein